jgi:hypothetical protein
MPIYKYDVCFPNTQSVIRTFSSLTRARDFMRFMSADDLPFLVMPWDENSSPLIVRRVKTPRKYHTQKAQSVAILGPSQQKG